VNLPGDFQRNVLGLFMTELSVATAPQPPVSSSRAQLVLMGSPADEGEKRPTKRRLRADRTAAFGWPWAPRLRVRISVAPAAIEVLQPTVARIATSRDRP
jgi:hypothetical protein